MKTENYFSFNRVAEVEKFEFDFLTQKKITLPEQSGHRNSR